MAGPTAPITVGEFEFRLATPADDADIRRVLAQNPVPGRVTVAYEREPDYFLGCATMGHFWQIPVGRHQGQLVGLGSRAVRPMFVNGQIEQVGYLGQLRIDAAFQGRWALSGAWHFMHQLHGDGRASGYITTIIEGNTLAEGVLVRKPRRHYPQYHPIGRLCTLALILRRGKSAAMPGGLALRRGSAEMLPAICDFLREHGAAKQFFPVYRPADFASPVTLGFDPADFVLAFRGEMLVGVMGLWDQSAYKQSIVRAYGGALSWLRPACNLWLRVRGAQPLPVPGASLHYAYASFICLANDDPLVFRALLADVYRMAATRGYAYLMVGLMDGDPLLSVARAYPHVPYYSQLYTVNWAADSPLHARLDGRIPYVDIATL